MQFHLEVDVSLATDWGDVPAYADSLRALLGEDGLSQLTDAIAEHERGSIALARSLFSRWLEQVVGGPGGRTRDVRRVAGGDRRGGDRPIPVS